MDGFYVCKIQKLSNKIPGETQPVEGEEIQVEEVEKEPKTSNDAEVAKPKKQDSKKGHHDKKRGKKRRGADKEEKPKKKSKAEKISVPPPKQKQQKKKKLNAKTLKPRRKKVDEEM